MISKANVNIRIFSDGACSGNPGPGAWGVVVYFEEQSKEFSGFDLETTNNRMELQAAIEGLKAVLPYPKSSITLFSDSLYVVKGITEWIHNWEKKNWVTSQKKPVENQILWKQLLALKKQFDCLSWQWVAGHSGDLGNERADQLARKALIDAPKIS